MEFGSLSLDFAASGLDDAGNVAQALAAVLMFEPVVRPEDHDDASRLRQAIARAFAAAAEGSPFPDRDIATMNSHAADEPPALRLMPTAVPMRASPDPVRASLAALARDAIETIARDGQRLRACAGADCRRIFLDRSHGKRRRWCSMRGCGNRAKVTAFRKRSSIE